jgi:hypothetical protein
VNTTAQPHHGAQPDMGGPTVTKEVASRACASQHTYEVPDSDGDGDLVLDYSSGLPESAPFGIAQKEPVGITLVTR